MWFLFLLQKRREADGGPVLNTAGLHIRAAPSSADPTRPDPRRCADIEQMRQRAEQEQAGASRSKQEQGGEGRVAA